MLAIISPAKSIDMSKGPNTGSIPIYNSMAAKLVKELKGYSVDDLQQLMKISPKLAQLNYDRFQHWTSNATEKDVASAIYAFRGDVYTGIDVDNMDAVEVDYLENHLRILSGLYGLLKPKDIIQAYRLEMGTRLQLGKFKSLYEFWGDSITRELVKTLKENREKVLINLASNEYAKSIDMTKIGVRVVTPVFKDYKNGQYKIISFFAKKARGRMVAFMAKENLQKADDLKGFDYDGYHYNEEMSSDDIFVFTRG